MALRCWRSLAASRQYHEYRGNRPALGEFGSGVSWPPSRFAAGAMQYSGEHPVWRDIRLAGCRFCVRGVRHHVAITGKRATLRRSLTAINVAGADWLG